MLKIIIPGNEFYDETTETFSTVNDVVVELEHSLISVSKWESKFEKPFLGPQEKTSEEVFAYIKAMLLHDNYPEEVLLNLSSENIREINSYIDSKQSATTFGKMPERRGPGEVVTSELIYYWMVAFNIPFECENWHLNRLFSLIRICNIKNGKPQKRSANEIAQRNREINEQRRKQIGTTG